MLKGDFFARFSRDRQARPQPGEVAIDTDWTLLVPADADPLVRLMAGHLAEFLRQRIELPLSRAEKPRDALAAGIDKAIVLTAAAGGDAAVPERFTITSRPIFIGPARPMCADAAAEVPEIFYGYYLVKTPIGPSFVFQRRS